jgi:hypothetical protein
MLIVPACNGEAIERHRAFLENLINKLPCEEWPTEKQAIWLRAIGKKVRAADSN